MILFVSLIISCQFSDILNGIDKQVSSINRNIKKYIFTEYVDVDLRVAIGPEYSIEGSEIKNLAMINIDKYSNEERSMKLIVSFDGEQAELISKYYVWSGNLIYVEKEMKYYDLPRWHDSFDSSKVEIIQNKYYFTENRMVMWIDRLGVKRKVRVEELINAEAKILHDYNLYRAYK